MRRLLCFRRRLRLGFPRATGACWTVRFWWSVWRRGSRLRSGQCRYGDVNDSKSGVRRIRLAVQRFCVARAVGAGAQSFRGTIGSDGPFADVTAEVKYQFIVLLALAGEAA